MSRLSFVAGLGRALVALAALAWIAPACAVDRTDTAIAAIARQFDAHPLVMLGELHRSREIHAFLQRMLRDPGLICRVDDVVVEFGNSRLQPVIDAYVAGAAVPELQLRDVWRETAVPLTWNSPVYRQVFETLRDINARHLCAHPIRALLGDPPLDWSKIHTVSEYAAFTDRDASYAGVVERAVLARHQRALLVAGELHAMKRIPDDLQSEPGERSVARMLEDAHPGVLFSIVTVSTPNAANALQMGAAPAFHPVQGNWRGQANCQWADWDSTVTPTLRRGRRGWLLRPAKRWPRIGAVVDGLLYLGGNHSVYPSPMIYLERGYQQELRRRAAIIKQDSGQDFMPAIDALVAQGTHERDAVAPQSAHARR